MACADHLRKRTSRRHVSKHVQTIRRKGQVGEMCNGLCRPSAEKDKCRPSAEKKPSAEKGK